jgi:cytochrome P450
MYKGKLRSKLAELHQKHGTIVRYGINCVSISDPAAITTIYTNRAKFISADSYKTLIGVSDGKEVYTVISAPDQLHAALRRSVAAAFTPTAVLDYEKYIDQTIPELLEELEKRKIFDFAEMMTFYSMDAASRFAFSETLGCIRNGSDVGNMIGTVRERFLYWGRWSSLSRLERLIHRNPITLHLPRTPSNMVKLATTKLQTRVTQMSKSSNNGGSVEKKDDLLQRYLDASTQYPDTLNTMGIVGMLMSTISGAGDTTAGTMGATFYYLLKNPDTIAKLRTELHDAGVPLIPAYAQIRDLPYLDAVIKEAMRLFPLVNLPLERVVPAGGATIAGHFFRQGTTVGVLPSVIHRNEAMFGEDVEAFRPDRWLEVGPEKLRLMEAAHMGFSRGKRACLGQHIALLQMKKLFAALVMKMNVSLTLYFLLEMAN